VYWRRIITSGAAAAASTAHDGYLRGIGRKCVAENRLATNNHRHRSEFCAN